MIYFKGLSNLISSTFEVLLSSIRFLLEIYQGLKCYDQGCNTFEAIITEGIVNYKLVGTSAIYVLCTIFLP